MKKKISLAVAVGIFAVGIFIICGKDITIEKNDVENIPETEITVGDAYVEEIDTDMSQKVDSEIENPETQVAENETANGSSEETSPTEGTNTAPSIQPEEDTDNWIGSDLAHTESVVTSSGVEIPVLNKFNEAGLNPTYAESDEEGDWDWFGYAGSEDAPGYRNVEACAAAMKDLAEALNIEGGFLPQQEHISFSYTDQYASVGDLELRRDFENGYYTVGINYDMSDSEQLYSTESGKEVLTLLCSVFSSTPSELAEFLYNESFVAEEFTTSETEWVAVGDCLVQWGGYNCNEQDMLVYRVKAKQENC